MHKWSQYSLTSENIGLYEEIFENLKIIDCHAHLGQDKDHHQMTAARLIKLMDESNVDKAIIFPLNNPSDTVNFHGSNDSVLQAAKKYPERFIPFFRLTPHKRWRDEFNLRVQQGFKGLKLHPRSQRFRLKFSKAMKMYDIAEKNNLAIMMHAAFGLEEIADDLLVIVKKFPKLRLIVGHSGFVDLDNVIKKIAKMENVLFDSSAVKIFDLFELFKKVEYTKIVFGSDSPYYDIDLALEGLIDTAITVGKTANQIRKILGGNITKWFP